VLPCGPHAGTAARPPPLAGPLSLLPIVITLSLLYRIDVNVDQIDVNVDRIDVNVDRIDRQCALHVSQKELYVNHKHVNDE
jgi:hypothetical protein